MAFTVFVLVLCLCLWTNDLTLCDEKRLLLNDDSYMQQQLDHLQSEVQNLRVDFNAQLSSQNSKITTLESTVTRLSQGGSGAVYTRWGRKTCPSDNNTDLIYSGFVAGANSGARGGASNTLCLPSDPTWGQNKYTSENKYSTLIGAEYEDPNLFNIANYRQDIPCAVCHSKSHVTSIMIAGRAQCYPTWTETYQGNLAAGWEGFTGGSQYICMDQNPETLHKTAYRNDNGHVFFNGVKSHCGTVSCPPYEENRQLACVVCLK